MRFSFLFLSFAVVATAFAQQTNLNAGWHKQTIDTIITSRVQAATDYIKEKRLKVKKKVVVAVLDSGIDTTTTAVMRSIWTNKKERPDGKDNDRNGYIDDVHGWNFLGTKDGSFNMISAGTEEYREFKRMYPKYKDQSAETVTDTTEYAYYLRMKKKAGIVGYLKFYEFAKVKMACIQSMDSIISLCSLQPDTLSLQELSYLDVKDSIFYQAYQTIYVDLIKAGREMKWQKFVQQQTDQLALMQTRIDGIEHAQDKRLLMGDDMNDATDRYYGNAILQVDGCEHGTFVASVIAGQADDARYSGVYPDAQLMILRVCPEGDEYDKDVATAIRYAVDNGARVINMSLGKYTSPDAAMVNEAIAYAHQKDVLLVAAAGNNHLNIDKENYFPSACNAQGVAYDNYLRVGACTPHGEVAPFSNYGTNHVDLFAPGVKIAGVMPGNSYEMEDGTSVATPIVAGIAAMIRSYYPRLKAATVKRILMDTVQRVPDMPCVSGGIVDAIEAFKKANTER